MSKTTIRGGTESWAKAYNAGNVCRNKIVALYAEDALIMPPGFPIARGHTAIRQYLEKDTAATKAAGLTLVLGSNDETGISGNLAWHSGSYTVRDKSGMTINSGSYMEAWRKTGEKWVIIRDIWNSDRPSAPAPK